MYLSGWLRKEGISIDTAIELIQRICEDDEEKDARLRTLDETYQKETVNDIKGYSGLIELLTDELGDEQKARTFLDELRSLLEQVQKKNEEDELVDEGQEQKSIVEEASEAIMTKHRLLTIEETKDILYYRNGMYVLGGEILIEKEAERTYGYKLANRHLSEIKGHIMRSTYRTREEIDPDLNIINLKNGLYNFQTGEFREHSPNYISVNQLPIPYDSRARPKLFGQFLREVLYASEIRTAVDMMAYTFYRDNPFEIITILFGYGANGKSVYTRLLTELHSAKNIRQT
jgi:phage/plasmid-associated DNA primase